MSVEYFLDTNILIYSFDEKAPEKQERSQMLIEKVYSKDLQPGRRFCELELRNPFTPHSPF